MCIYHVTTPKHHSLHVFVDKFKTKRREKKKKRKGKKKKKKKSNPRQSLELCVIGSTAQDLNNYTS